jgi:hypothetical protein
MLRRLAVLGISVLMLALAQVTSALAQQHTEPRIAFVVGNSAYGPGALPSALNDAGLVAEALRSIGFQIVEGADLSQPDFLRVYREFLGKVEAAGPDTLAFVYFSGHAASFEGENFLLGVDARLARDSDIPIEGVRLNDLLRPLADSPARAKVMTIDAARPLPFRPQGKPLARGLEAVDPPQGVLIAYSSAPGTIAPDRPGDYGAYATAIAEMLRAPGTDLDTAFTHIRSRTHVTSDGQQTPWHFSAIGEPIELVPAAAATASTPQPPPVRQARPMREIGPEEAYALAIEMDTLEGYTEFVQAYPGHPLTRRVWAMIRARREALAWMRALEINTPRAYWTYLRRYPNGMYVADAERRLRRLGQPFGPPQGFVAMEFDDVPMALADEPVEYEEVYEVGPPPPRLVYGAPRPAYLTNLPPPRRRAGAALLPALAIAIPLAAALAPAPRRTFAPGTGPAGRSGAFGGRNRAAPASVAPASVAPSGAPSAVAPSAVAPSATAPSATAPSATSPGQGRRPGTGPGPGQRPGGSPPGAPAATAPSITAPAPGAAPSATAPTTAPAAPVQPPAAGQTPGRRPGGPPPGLANRPPPSAPTTTTPGAAPTPSAPSNPPPPATGRRPGGPPPNIANRPPSGSPPAGASRPAGPPPSAVARPTPPATPPAARPAPPRPPGPPPQAASRPAPPPPPKPAAPAAAAKPPACPAGKTLQNGVCK